MLRRTDRSVARRFGRCRSEDLPGTQQSFRPDFVFLEMMRNAIIRFTLRNIVAGLDAALTIIRDSAHCAWSLKCFEKFTYSF